MVYMLWAGRWRSILQGEKIIARKPDYLFAGNSPLHGRGVFTSRPIRRGKIIETAPLIVLDKAASDIVKQSSLYRYYFLDGAREESCLIGLGYAFLYNHQCPANAAYECRPAERLMIFSAVRDIAAGEEITINYNGTPDDTSPVTFDAPNDIS